MTRWVWLASALALTSCGTFTGQVQGDPNREQLGFSAHDPAGAAGDGAPAPAVDQKLDWKMSQICTRGAVTLSETREPAENDGRLVDRTVRCQPYGFSVLGIPLAGVVPF
ncbi:MAG TPA: hypothetical protein VLV50_02170 [Stellaceae bacterium]|nr:hypothetical protein [Stellaceae bacterium]